MAPRADEIASKTSLPMHARERDLLPLPVQRWAQGRQSAALGAARTACQRRGRQRHQNALVEEIAGALNNLGHFESAGYDLDPTTAQSQALIF